MTSDSNNSATAHIYLESLFTAFRLTLLLALSLIFPAVTMTYRGHETAYSKVLESYILPCHAKQSTTLPLTTRLAGSSANTVCVLRYRARDIRAKIRVFHMTHTKTWIFHVTQCRYVFLHVIHTGFNHCICACHGDLLLSHWLRTPEVCDNRWYVHVG